VAFLPLHARKPEEWVELGRQHEPSASEISKEVVEEGAVQGEHDEQHQYVQHGRQQYSKLELKFESARIGHGAWYH
jgi:hypothetical protein